MLCYVMYNWLTHVAIGTILQFLQHKASMFIIRRIASPIQVTPQYTVRFPLQQIMLQAPINFIPLGGEAW